MSDGKGGRVYIITTDRVKTDRKATIEQRFSVSFIHSLEACQTQSRVQLQLQASCIKTFGPENHTKHTSTLTHVHHKEKKMQVKSQSHLFEEISIGGCDFKHA